MILGCVLLAMVFVTALWNLHIGPEKDERSADAAFLHKLLTELVESTRSQGKNP
jgi:hypothetical protein